MGKKIVQSKPINAAVLHCARMLLFVFTSHYLGMAQTETPVGQLIKGLENKDTGTKEQADGKWFIWSVSKMFMRNSQFSRFN